MVWCQRIFFIGVLALSFYVFSCLPVNYMFSSFGGFITSTNLVVHANQLGEKMFGSLSEDETPITDASMTVDEATTLSISVSVSN